MRLPDAVFTSLFELVIALVELLGAVLLTVLGVGAELAAVGGLADGPTVMVVWFAYMGAVALFWGVELLGRRRVLPRITARLV